MIENVEKLGAELQPLVFGDMKSLVAFGRIAKPWWRVRIPG